MPGLTSVDWFRGEEHLETRDLVTSEEQRLVNSLTLDTSSLELGEAVILCRPDLVTAGINNKDMAASARIKLVEEAMEPEPPTELAETETSNSGLSTSNSGVSTPARQTSTSSNNSVAKTEPGEWTIRVQ